MPQKIRVGDEVIVTGGKYIMTVKGTIGIIINIIGNRGLLRFKHKNGSMQQCNVRLEYLAIHIPEDELETDIITEEPNIEDLELTDPIDEQEQEELEAAAEADLIADIDPDEAINYDDEVARLEGKTVAELKEICKCNEYTGYTTLKKNQLVLFIMGGGVK